MYNNIIPHYLPRVHAQGMKQSVCLSVVISTKTAQSGDIGTLVSCNGDQTINMVINRLCLAWQKMHGLVLHGHLSTTPTADHVLSAHISTIHTWSFEVLGNY